MTSLVPSPKHLITLRVLYSRVFEEYFPVLSRHPPSHMTSTAAGTCRVEYRGLISCPTSSSAPRYRRTMTLIERFGPVLAPPFRLGRVRVHMA